MRDYEACFCHIIPFRTSRTPSRAAPLSKTPTSFFFLGQVIGLSEDYGTRNGFGADSAKGAARASAITACSPIDRDRAKGSPFAVRRSVSRLLSWFVSHKVVNGRLVRRSGFVIKSHEDAMSDDIFQVLKSVNFIIRFTPI